jgi:tetratricopeptide (TPR) repeat protein
MSLLNEALRKKASQYRQPKKTGYMRNEPKALTKGKTKRYIIAFLVVLISTIGALGTLKLFYLPDPAFNKSPMIAASPVQQTVKTRNFVQPEQMQVEQKQEVKKEAKLEAIVSGEPKPQNKKNDHLIAEPKRIFKSGPTKTINPPLTEVKKINRKKKSKVSIKKATKTAIDHGTLNLYFQKALTYHRQNKLDEAIHMYQKVLWKNPEHFDALFNLASAYIKTSAFSKAYPLLNKLKGLDSEKPEVLLNLAIVEIALGRLQSALASLSIAEKQKDGPLFEIYFHRSVALSQLGNLNEAIVWYKRAEELHPNHSRLLFNIALVYDKMQNYPEAIRYYSKFLKQDLSSSNEKKEVVVRILLLKAYMTGQSEKFLIQKHE